MSTSTYSNHNFINYFKLNFSLTQSLIPNPKSLSTDGTKDNDRTIGSTPAVTEVDSWAPVTGLPLSRIITLGVACWSLPEDLNSGCEGRERKFMKDQAYFWDRSGLPKNYYEEGVKVKNAKVPPG